MVFYDNFEWVLFVMLDSLSLIVFRNAILTLVYVISPTTNVGVRYLLSQDGVDDDDTFILLSCVVESDGGGGGDGGIRGRSSMIFELEKCFKKMSEVSVTGFLHVIEERMCV